MMTHSEFEFTEQEDETSDDWHLRAPGAVLVTWSGGPRIRKKHLAPIIERGCAGFFNVLLSVYEAWLLFYYCQTNHKQDSGKWNLY